MSKITNDSTDLAEDAYSCTHMATVGVKWLMIEFVVLNLTEVIGLYTGPNDGQCREIKPHCSCSKSCHFVM